MNISTLHKRWRLAASVLAVSTTAVLAVQVSAQSAPAKSAIAEPSKWPSARSPAAITDPATERMISQYLAHMTIEQKVGQVIQADISAIKPEDLAVYPLGSLLAGGNSGPYGNERASAADWHRLIEESRAISSKPVARGAAIPIVFGIDAVHGHANLPNATVFPHNVGLGAAHDVELIGRIARATAEELSGSGIEWTFAPTLAVPQDGRWGRAYEGYSSDPKLVASYAGAMVRGLQGKLVPGKPIVANRVAATAKHFLADGGTDGGRDQGDATLDEKTLIDVHAAGYPPAINAGVMSVMISFSSWNGVKNHGNKSLITDVLKGRMGFLGPVVGDWNGHGQVEGCTTTNCPQSLLAGLDLYMASDSWKGLYESLLAQAKAGQIPMERLDDAVTRVLRLKAKLGLIGPNQVKRYDPSQIGSPAHLAIAREAVAKSLVLLKNNGSVLPVKPGAKVLIAGDAADDMSRQVGGWTISWQGRDVTKADFTNGQTVYEAIASAVGESGGKAVLSKDGAFTDKPDVAIVVFGEPAYAEFEGDRPTLAFETKDGEAIKLLKKLKAAGIPVVSVFLSGRPMFVSPHINASDAFVAAWQPGSQGNGIADVLVARKNGKPVRDFTGRLSFPWPADARAPVDKPLFALGHGLSYAKPARLGLLSEDAKVDLTALFDNNQLFDRGGAQGNWQLHIADAAGDRAVVTVPASSLGGKIRATGVDLEAQEDGRRFVFTGPASFSIVGPAVDFARQLNNSFVVRIDVKVDALQGPALLGFGGQKLDVTKLLASLPKGKVTTTKVSLRCFANAGAKVGDVIVPFSLDANAGTDVTIKTLRIEATGEDLPCP